MVKSHPMKGNFFLHGVLQKHKPHWPSLKTECEEGIEKGGHPSLQILRVNCLFPLPCLAYNDLQTQGIEWNQMNFHALWQLPSHSKPKQCFIKPSDPSLQRLYPPVHIANNPGTLIGLNGPYRGVLSGITGLLLSSLQPKCQTRACQKSQQRTRTARVGLFRRGITYERQARNAAKRQKNQRGERGAGTGIKSTRLKQKCVQTCWALSRHTHSYPITPAAAEVSESQAVSPGRLCPHTLTGEPARSEKRWSLDRTLTRSLPRTRVEWNAPASWEQTWSARRSP